ncbi:MAG: membrane dipeptidase [Acidobacteria bacterium RIFCSPLOWO2_02_FULL_68_18]|nr:MAG: membrane dipeptidase [Acidobacteria bacterium RIFCSPLOWO2_02_FULL_68_18]OFW50789.1 MAG: membrane dipeptidase [Acidobacteria bacterium RIFCSPLOWO2_12_FULL_68_19]
MFTLASGLQAQQGGDLLARARALHREVPLIDGHNDYPWALREHSAGRDLDTLDIRTAQPTLHTDIPRLRQGGVGGQFWSVYVPATLQGAAAVRATLEQIDVVHRMARKYGDTFELATTAAEVERIFRAGRIASLIGMEGGHAIDNSLATLRMFHVVGARYMTLTHSANVPWADSGTDVPRLGGLSPFGEEVVREMNRLGMLVDLSHTSSETMLDALRVSEAPVIFSHSDTRALNDHGRNVPDDVLRLLPGNGGIVMVTFVPAFLVPGGRATLADVASHMEHVRKVAGADHVGIGSDFDGVETLPAGLEDVSKYPALTSELLRRGWPEADVRKALGLNILRVMRRAEQVAARLQRQREPSRATIEALDSK